MFFESTTYLIENPNKGNMKWFWSFMQNPNYFETLFHLILNPLEIGKGNLLYLLTLLIYLLYFI